MYWYNFNVGDYRSHTAHLTPTEHYIYRSLIDWYYLNERPMPATDLDYIARILLLKRQRIFARDNYTCIYCGANEVKLHCDHIIPFIKGGSNDDDNLATACEHCNKSKGSKSLEEWGGR